MALRYFDLEAFRATPLTREPFQYIIVPDFVREQVRTRIIADYPSISERGSYPVGQHAYGAAFQELLDELEGDEFRQAFEEKFDIDLSARPTMTTVRGQCSAEDGQIHTDATSKIVTVLIYMNPGWQESGGQLRLLRSADNLEDVAAEVRPTWSLLAFKRAVNSWHGHKPFEGERRVVQLHWVTSQWYQRIQTLRHQKSALAKRMLGSLSFGNWRIT
jgi:SM-20-related protein